MTKIRIAAMVRTHADGLGEVHGVTVSGLGPHAVGEVVAKGVVAVVHLVRHSMRAEKARKARS